MLIPHDSSKPEEPKSPALVWVFNLVFLGSGNVYAAGSRRIKALLFGLVFQFGLLPMMSDGLRSVLWVLVYFALGIDGYLQIKGGQNRFVNGNSTDWKAYPAQKLGSRHRYNDSNISPYASTNFETKLQEALVRQKQEVDDDISEPPAKLQLPPALVVEPVCNESTFNESDYKSTPVDTSNEPFKIEPLVYAFGSQTNTGDNPGTLSQVASPLIAGTASAEPCANCSSPRTGDFAFCLNCGHSYGLG